MKRILFLIILLAGTFTDTNAQSLDFDGSDDYVDIGNIIPAGSSYTKETWLYARANSCNNIISSGPDLMYLSSGNLSAGNGGNYNQVTDPNPFPLNVWTHVAVSYDATSGTMTIYKNGVQVAQGTASVYQGGPTVYIGRYTGGCYMNGMFDEVHIWGVARTATQIQSDMNCSFITAQPGLIASYNFNQGTPNGTNTGITTLTDGSGNNNNGTLSNFALTGTSSNWVADVNVTSVYPDVTFSGSANICSGGSTVLTVSSTLAATYAWSANAGSVHTTTVNISPAATDIYTVSVTNGVCIATDTIKVNVTITPTVSITGSTNVCSGTTATITASGATTYSWSANAGSATTASISGIINSTKTFSVTGANVACTGVASITVNVATTPTVNIINVPTICRGDDNTLSAIGATNYLWSANAGSAPTATATPTTNATDTYTVIGTTGICTDTATITVTVNNTPTVSVSSETICAEQTTTLTVNSSAAISYLWNTGETTASIFSGSTSNTNYSVTVTDANGCKGSTTATVTVNSLPIISVNSPAICIGDMTTLTAGGTATTFTWSTTETGISITPSPTTTTNYTVTGTDANGCENAATTVITVNNLPTVSVSSATACAGSPTALTASGAFTYTWSTTQLGASISPSATATTNYTVDGSDANGCVNSAIATLTVIALPAISITGNSAVVCGGATTTLTANGANTYSWSTSALTASTVVTPTTTTDYTVTGRDNTTTCINTAVATVTVTPLPDNTVVVSNGNLLTAINAIATYQWIDCSAHAVISGETGQNFTPAVSGSYQVQLTENGCVDTSTCYAITISGINSFINDKIINIYPNPTTDAFYLQTNMVFDNATVEVYDMIGQKILVEKLQSNLTRLIFNNLSSAVYQVRIISNNALIYQNKIIKQ